ncbi:GNAT family N-acetyltransferase [Piscirickettsia litoralis]|uniref:GNAT family N-acetyltransferase n=1 Tax=Piscirickettsia litoralis TaxID=1891921 RepID=A0ABX3A797_9GAMM|nr:GNAT family N-acetyltransferase [Piscirickettsia litoralis]ODN43508.1 GNAT family N-acetyltransferase [Piscirickettsia litoralis]
MTEEFKIKTATVGDVPVILQFIKELAEYERMSDDVVATDALLTKNLFGKNSYAEVIIGYYRDEPVGFALFFHNFSTFLAKPGIYLEDLYVQPQLRGKGFGKILLNYITELARKRDCGRVEWSVLDWNEPSIQFYKKLGAKPMDEWTVYRLEENLL